MTDNSALIGTGFRKISQFTLNNLSTVSSNSLPTDTAHLLDGVGSTAPRLESVCNLSLEKKEKKKKKRK